MPKGVPVATVALDGAANAGLLAVQILGSGDEILYTKLIEYKEDVLKEKVTDAITKVKGEYPNHFDL